MVENIGARANVLVRRYNDKLVIIYDDHRWLLNVLFKFYIENNGATYNVVTFDAHDDAAECPAKSALLRQIGVAKLADATEKQFGAFVDFDVSSDDGNWLSVACELDLIKNSCTIGNRNNNNIENLNNEYISESGEKHYIFELSENLDEEIGSRGKLGDTCRDEECLGVRKFFDSGDKYYKRIGSMEPFILDFDLDFFTISSDKGTMAWPPKIWQQELGNYSDNFQFINTLINKADIITICREPDYCGGIGESNKILEMLDRYFFYEQLGTSAPY